jgi:hypothetical protein
MLQNRQDKQRNTRSIQLPRQTEAPNLRQIEYLFEQCSAPANMGRAIELPFGGDATFGWLLTVMRHQNQEAQWMFYRMGQGTSALEWSQMTNDPNMIAGAICAQFPEVDLSVKDGSTGLNVPILFQTDGETPELPQQSSSIAAAKPKAKAVMEGDLQHLQPVNLLNSVAVGKMSGRLEITGETDTANVYFVEGNPTHCTLRGAEGDAAMIELVSWDSGLYRFFHEVPPRDQTVNKRLELLLQEGSQINDQHKALKQNGLQLESYLMRSHPNITELAFEQAAAAHGAAVDLGLQKAIYQAIDNSSTLFELLRRLPLNKQDWVPALYNMLTCQLISFTNTKPVAAPVSTAGKQIVPTPVDWTAVRQSDRVLYRADTGAMTVPAFLGFLEREQLRFEVTHRPYALVVIELGVCGEDGNLEPLSNQGVREIVSHLETLKRKCDVVGHYETFGIGLILPETTCASAKTLARSLADALLVRKPKEGGRRIVLNLGVGSIPEDCLRLEELLTVAKPGR